MGRPTWSGVMMGPFSSMACPRRMASEVLLPSFSSESAPSSCQQFIDTSSITSRLALTLFQTVPLAGGGAMISSTAPPSDSESSSSKWE